MISEDELVAFVAANPSGAPGTNEKHVVIMMYISVKSTVDC